MWLVRATLFLLLAGALAGQPPLYLKSRQVRPTETQPAAQIHRRNPGQVHWIVQFPTAPAPAQLDQLRSRGARILSYVPDFGLSVAAADDTDFADLGLQWIGKLEAQDKTSPMLDLTSDASAVQFAVVEFHPDVDMNDARAIVLNLQLQIQENPDLLDHHLLVIGSSDQIAGLGQWDEVAYIFPASDELTQGIPVHACAGALTAQGSVGQSILQIGDGWGGPGRNRADLNYAFFSKTPKLSSDAVTSEIVRAFAEWAKYAKLTFTPIDDPQASRTLAILFASRSHGDGYPFDGPGGILAHTFYPYPMNPEPIAGDLHFDADENWNIGADVDLFSVALHETGHALGLGHSDKPGSVMYPYYRKSTALTAEDIGAVLNMYAAQDATPAGATPLALTIDQPGASTDASVTLHGTASGGSGDIRISWASDRGFSGVAQGGSTWTAGAIALGLGPNTITVTAKDAQSTQIARTIVVTRQPVAAPPASDLQLDITTPVAGGAFTTNVNSVSLSGTASSASGIARVTWSNSQGGSGQAAGTATWTTGAIGLQSGISTIAITAYAPNGPTAVRTLQVSYVPATGNSTAPPSLTIVTPALSTVSTPASSITISGTARDGAGIAAVTWTNSTGPSGTATGTSSWSITGIPLLVGTNTITIHATNLGGLTAWRSIVVTRL
jgi:Matrixin